MNIRHIGILVGIGLTAAILGVGCTKRQTWSSSVLSLEGDGWHVAADPDNVGRDQAWWKGPTSEARPTRVPGILQEALPAYHGVAWYWHMFASPAQRYPRGRCLLRFHSVDYLAHVWVNDIFVGGHEGGETPFTLDVTSAIKPAMANRLAVRVLNPKADPIDGIILAETPHRNKAPAGIRVGGSYNSGGITEPVEVLWVPAAWIDNVHVRPDWKNGEVRVAVAVTNSSLSSIPGQIQLVVTSASANEPIAAASFDQKIAPGMGMAECRLNVENHRLWRPEDPFLYHLTVRLLTGRSHDVHENVTRFGFRELRVEKGYFQLNGKRLFLKSAHTGNHCPVGAVLPPPGAPDLLRKDLLYMKACGFNTVRFIAGVAHPYQLDLCDEIGLMVYEENMASWLLAESPKMVERFDANLREMVLRDRNHPSVVIFGLVNEMKDGPMTRHAVASLDLLRSIDDSRLVIQQSGRWDGQYRVGSVCNPGGSKWEHVWGAENPEYEGTAPKGPWGGYFEGAGDAHVYPSTPHTPAIEAGIRKLGAESKPVFLSEYGIGSLMNAIRELRYYEQNDANPEWDDFKYFQQTEKRLEADWMRLGMDGVYAFPEEMLRASQQMHCRQRELGFSLIRSNPKICGYNLTGLLDHGYTGEGLWTFWREFKPGIMDTLQEGWAPLRWCLFASPMHGYVGRPIKLEAVLANENALAPNAYPAWFRVLGPNGVAWEKKLELVIPQPPDREGGPLAIPVFTAEVTLPGPAGQYTFAATLQRGGAPTAGRLMFRVSDRPKAEAPLAVVSIGVDARAREWLTSHGVTIAPLEQAGRHARSVILVGSAASFSVTPAFWSDVLRRVAQGSTVVFLDPGIFRKGNDPVGWLPFRNKGRLTQFSDWLYHKECVARQHVLFFGLAPKGIMDWDYYGPLISNRFFEGQDTPQDVAAAAFAICHSSRPDGYASGVMLGAYPFGSGKILLNTFNLLDHVDRHPAADRLLLNLMAYAATTTQEPPAPLPADFETTLRELGY